ncbi:MAG: hypothetical protein ACYCWW_05985 [Deltaproteobacteria bacterium]
MKLWTRPGRILRVAPGYNPNSSSLGVDVSFLLFGSIAVTAVTFVTATAVRLWRHRAEAKGRESPAA